MPGCCLLGTLEANYVELVEIVGQFWPVNLPVKGWAMFQAVSSPSVEQPTTERAATNSANMTSSRQAATAAMMIIVMVMGNN